VASSILPQSGPFVSFVRNLAEAVRNVVPDAGLQVYARVAERLRGYQPETELCVALEYGELAADFKREPIARSAFDWAWSIATGLWKSGRLLTGDELRGLSDLARRCHRFDEALDAARRLQQQGGTDLEGSEWRYKGLGAEAATLVDRGDATGAEEKYRELVDYSASVFGQEDYWTGFAQQSLGTHLFHQERYREALPFLTGTLASFRRNMPPQDDNVACAEFDVGECLDKLGEDTLATLHYERAHQIYLVTRGPDDPKTVLVAGNIGEMFRVRGDFVTAERWIRRAMEAEHGARGRTSRYAHYCNNLAETLVQLDQLSEARILAGIALELRRRLFGDNSIQFSRSIDLLAQIANASNDYQAALEFIDRAHAVVAALNDQLGVAIYGRLRAICYGHIGDFQKAEQFCRCALTSLIAAGADQAAIFRCEFELSVYLFCLGRTAEAKCHAVAALEREDTELLKTSQDISRRHLRDMLNSSHQMEK
jgi:tetratricopeptide (TPR) repeat protein